MSTKLQTKQQIATQYLKDMNAREKIKIHVIASSENKKPDK